MTLRLHDVWAAHGTALALQGVSLEVPDGGVAALLGANGTGKSSTLQAIAGLLPLRKGEISFRDVRLDGASADVLVRAGVALVAAGRRLFAEMTVLENLRLGAYVRKDVDGVRRDLGRVLALFPVLAERAALRAGLLSGGEQQMLAMGRALMSRPQLLLLDEPSTGLAPLVTRQIFDVVREVQAEGVTVLIAEQHARLTLEIAEHGFVLAAGRVQHAATAAELLSDDTIRRSYLGD